MFELKLGTIQVIFPNFHKILCSKNISSNSKSNNLHLTLKPTVLVLRYLSLDLNDLFLKAQCIPRALLSENCSLLGTNNAPGQISEHMFTSAT